MLEEDEAISKKEFVYDFFIDENPYVKERIERAVAQRYAKGFAQGVVEGMQRFILVAIKEWFPALVEQARPQIKQIQDADALETLFLNLLDATTERDVHQILHIQEKQ